MSTLSVRPISCESELLRELLGALGVDLASVFVTYVFSLDKELLLKPPRNICAILFVFPIGPPDGFFETRHTEAEQPPNAPWFARQTLRHACGTIALIHAVANSPLRARVRGESWLGRYLAQCEGRTPGERAELLANDAQSARCTTRTRSGRASPPRRTRRSTPT
jgi:ubiquitin carboxyl-terminal hydrolase L3